MSAGLRQHVVEIISDADEGEAFLEELPNAAGSKQEQPQDDIVLPGRVHKFVDARL